MEGFSSNLTQMFTPTGQCAEHILPFYQHCQGHWWEYESHLAIVLVFHFVRMLRIKRDVIQTQSFLIIPTYINIHLFRCDWSWHVLAPRLTSSWPSASLESSGSWSSGLPAHLRTYRVRLVAGCSLGCS